MNELIQMLRPDPARDWARLVGGIVLAVGMTLMLVRMSGTWGDFPLFLVVIVPSAGLYGVAVAGARAFPVAVPRPAAWQSAFLVTAVILLPVALARLAMLLGVEEPTSASGTATWVFALTAAAAAYAAWLLGSAVNALLAALAGGFSFLAFVDWVGDPGTSTFRWLLVGLAAIFAYAAYAERERRPAHSRYLVDAAGAAAIAAGALGGIGGVLGGLTPFSFGGAGSANGWELLLLASSLGLIAYAVRQRSWGAAYLGGAGLVLFVLIVGEPIQAAVTALLGFSLAEPSVAGWPILLTLAGLALLVASVWGPALLAWLGGRASKGPGPGPDGPHPPKGASNP